MKQEKFNELMINFLKSKEGEAAVGSIMLAAIAQSLEREMEFEDGHTEPGKTIHRTKTINVLDQLVFYLPHVEAAIRGVQSDAAQARNRAANTRDILLAMCVMAKRQGVDLTPDKDLQREIDERRSDHNQIAAAGSVAASETHLADQ